MCKHILKKGLWRIRPTSPSQEQSQFKAKSLSLIVAILLALGSGVCLGRSKAQTPTLGELRLEGKYIEHLTLRRNDGHTEVLNDPEETVRLPAGQYLVQDFRLQGGYNRLRIPRDNKVTISEGKTATLKLGGPLKQTISVRRQGRILELTYGLTGIGGETYSTSRNSDKRPSFTIYKGDRALASGEFEFG